MTNKILFKKKAEVPIVILVLGVLFLCVLAFVNFVIFSLDEEKYGNLEKIVSFEKCSSYIEQYEFYKNMGYSDLEIRNLSSFKQDNKSVIDTQNILTCNSSGLKITYLLK